LTGDNDRWMGSWSRDTILTLARNCPSVESLSIRVDCQEAPYDTKPRESWDPSHKALACLTSTSICPSCKTVECRATVSGYISRLILRQAPALEVINFHWPRLKHIEEEAVAVKDFLFYFVGFLALEEFSWDRSLPSQNESPGSWPPTLRRIEVCVCPCDQYGTRRCPRCAGRQQDEAAACMDDTDENLRSLSKRLEEAFEWACQDRRLGVGCAAWSDIGSFLHVSVTITARP
ncbi:hypothetical protein diail_2736, partial [Diaporthe ilicicola]